MTALATQDSTQQRSANFFRGTRREREQQVAFDSLEAQALIVVRASIEAHAQSIHRDLSPADLSRLLAAAQSQLRGLSPEDLRGISPSSSILKTITDYSFSAAPMTDLRSQAELAAAAALEQGKGTDAGATLAARMVRIAMERGERGSGARYNELGGGERYSQADTAAIAAAMNVAREYGMTWISPRDLLAIGPAGVKAIAETNLKESGYKALRDGVHYQGQDFVAFAKHAKLRDFDAEKTAHAMQDLVQAQPVEQQPALEKIFKGFDHAAAASYGNPADTAARQRLEEAGQRQKAALQAIAAQGPEQAERARRFEQEKKIEERFRATAVKVEAKAYIADTKVDDAIAGLNNPQPRKAEPPTPDSKSLAAKAPVPQQLKGQSPKQ
jgi:hypothetical protein